MVSSTFALASRQPIAVQFLKGVKRLSNTEYFDFYFSCSVAGRFLQWHFNNEPLTAFRITNDIGDSIVVETSTYVYTSTLLSSEPIEDDNQAMDAVLIMSFIDEFPSSFTITCGNGPLSQTIAAGELSNVSNSSLRHNSTYNENLVLDYIVSSKIIQNRTTHLFMCGAQHSLQLLQGNGPPISFSTRDTIGMHRTPSATIYAVNEQGIFIARSPFMTTSILIVADESDVHASCYYGSSMVRIQSNAQSITSTTSGSISGSTTKEVNSITLVTTSEVIATSMRSTPDITTGSTFTCLVSIY